MIDILREDNGSTLISFKKTLLTDANVTKQAIEDVMNAFLANNITGEIERLRNRPSLFFPTLANGAPGEVTDLSAISGSEQITLR